MMGKHHRSAPPQHQRKGGILRWILGGLFLLISLWIGLVYFHLKPMIMARIHAIAQDPATRPKDLGPITSEAAAVPHTPPKQQLRSEPLPEQVLHNVEKSSPDPAIDESYHTVFSTGCSEWQDWQSIGVYSSADTVGQKGPITRIASGCKPEQEVAIRHAMSHLPKRCRVHFAPGTQVKDHNGHTYKYANKPLGMMHWLMHADPPVPPEATIALVDPDFFFMRPLWHDSFSAPHKYFASGSAKKTPMPPQVTKGVMVAQRYGIGGTPWRKGPGRNKQKAWDLQEYFASIGRPNSPALAPDLQENTAGTWYSIGAPYIALASDWLPIATNWTGLMPMAVERNFGNLAEMYAMVLAVADYGIRPVMIDSLMISNTQCGDEGWLWVDAVPIERGCDPTVLSEETLPLPTFMHYCQSYHIDSLKEAFEANPGVAPNYMFSKYQVPNDILQCPAGSKAYEGGQAGKATGGKMRLGADGFLPDPPTDMGGVMSGAKGQLMKHRNNFAHCVSTRGVNQAARDYRSWFCEVEHNHPL